MTGAALLLVSLSTFLHAGWNLMARYNRTEAQFFRRMLLTVTAVGLIPAVISEAAIRSIPVPAWGYLAASGLFCGLYYFCLARAYASSDFTVVYPVARALPVLLVGLADVALGRAPSPVGWVGMLLVVIGCLLAPLQSFREVSARRYLNPASGWMLLTALSTVGYTLLDKAASSMIVPGPASAARYGYFFFLVSFLALLAFDRLWPTPSPSSSGSPGWRLPTLGGLFNFGAYWLILWAYQLSRQASYIVAFRQLSIVIGVIIAFWLYHEPGRAVRITAALLIAGGLITISLWG
ncbi:MAG: EamA family transporter [Anaerolineae bacterium]